MSAVASHIVYSPAHIAPCAVGWLGSRIFSEYRQTRNSTIVDWLHCDLFRVFLVFASFSHAVEMETTELVIWAKTNQRTSTHAKSTTRDDENRISIYFIEQYERFYLTERMGVSSGVRIFNFESPFYCRFKSKPPYGLWEWPFSLTQSVFLFYCTFPSITHPNWFSSFAFGWESYFICAINLW